MLLLTFTPEWCQNITWSPRWQHCPHIESVQLFYSEVRASLRDKLTPWNISIIKKIKDIDYKSVVLQLQPLRVNKAIGPVQTWFKTPNLSDVTTGGQYSWRPPWNKNQNRRVDDMFGLSEPASGCFNWKSPDSLNKSVSLVSCWVGDTLQTLWNSVSDSFCIRVRVSYRAGSDITSQVVTQDGCKQVWTVYLPLRTESNTSFTVS